MKNIFTYALILIALVIGLAMAGSAYNESAASKAYARGQARAMIITATSQATQGKAVVMFPYFAIAIIFLGVVLVLGIWVYLADQRHRLIFEQNKVLAGQSVIEKHYITEKIMIIAPPSNRKEFYKALSATTTPEGQAVLRINQ